MLPWARRGCVFEQHPAAKPAAKQPSTTTKPPSGSTTTTTSPTPKQVVIASPFQLPRGSARAVLVTDGDHLLLLGGFNGAKQTIAEILRIDPKTASASTAGSLNAAVHDAAGALVAGRPMVFGGGNITETAGVQAVGADGRVSTVGKLPIPRSDLATATIGDRTFIVGGYTGSTVRATTIATNDGVNFQSSETSRFQSGIRPSPHSGPRCTRSAGRPTATLPARYARSRFWTPPRAQSNRSVRYGNR